MKMTIFPYLKSLPDPPTGESGCVNSTSPEAFGGELDSSPPTPEILLSPFTPNR